MERIEKEDIKLVEYFNEHWYKINFIDPPAYLPSVTTKLGIIDKPFLARWRGDIGNREADLRLFESQEKGSNIHRGFNILLNGGAVLYQNKFNPSMTQEEISALSIEYPNFLIVRNQEEQVDLFKLKTWIEIVDPLLLAAESIVYSLIYKEAGTLDVVMKIKEGDYKINGSKDLFLEEGAYVVDLKTGSQIDDNAFMQIAAYSKMIEEMQFFPDDPIIGGLILHTGAKTKGGIRGLATALRTKEELEQDYLDYRHASELWLRKHKDDRPTVFEFPELLTLTPKETENANITARS